MNRNYDMIGGCTALQAAAFCTWSWTRFSAPRVWFCAASMVAPSACGVASTFIRTGDATDTVDLNETTEWSSDLGTPRPWSRSSRSSSLSKLLESAQCASLQASCPRNGKPFRNKTVSFRILLKNRFQGQVFLVDHDGAVSSWSRSIGKVKGSVFETLQQELGGPGRFNRAVPPPAISRFSHDFQITLVGLFCWRCLHSYRRGMHAGGK